VLVHPDLCVYHASRLCYIRDVLAGVFSVDHWDSLRFLFTSSIEQQPVNRGSEQSGLAAYDPRRLVLGVDSAATRRRLGGDFEATPKRLRSDF
jgi:hypothetical protein